MTRTLTLDDERVDASDRPRGLAPQLVLALDADRPLSRPARFSLSELDEVHVGRGPRRSRERDERLLALRLSDRFLSSSHARLVRRGERWLLRDDGSKNGTFVGEQRLTEDHVLSDGDVVVIGRTLLLFRARLATYLDEPDVDLSGTRLADAALTSLDAERDHELRRAVRLAATRVPTLVLGESGTGKELVARALHAHSGRRGPFVAINCGALSPTLVTSELFGVRKGAFSGATESRVGLVRSADGGTLFLDEVAELPLDAQAALLRVLQESEVLPVGGERPVKIDAKILAATHRDLEARVADGSFREDLYARLAGAQIVLPPLRARREELGFVIGTLLERDGASSVRFTADAARTLFAYDWPRNVRELEHALRAAVAVAGPGPIGNEHLPAPLREAPRAVLGEQRAHFLALVERHGGNVSAIARALSTSRSQVRRLAERHAVPLDEFR